MTPAQEIRQFLASGEYDALYSAWPGGDIVTKARKGERALKQALVAEVRRQATGRLLPPLPPGFNSSQFTLATVGPMVRGLFPRREQQTVLSLFDKSLVFLTPDNIERVLTGMTWMGTAWQVSNLYLGSLGLPGLDGKPACLVGLSEETTFFVSMAYFEEKDPLRITWCTKPHMSSTTGNAIGLGYTTLASRNSCSTLLSPRGNSLPTHARRTAEYWSRQRARPTGNASTTTMRRNGFRLVMGSTGLNWLIFWPKPWMPGMDGNVFFSAAAHHDVPGLHVRTLCLDEFSPPAPQGR